MGLAPERADALAFLRPASVLFETAPVKGALGVDFVAATSPTTLVAVGPEPLEGFRKPVWRLRIEQRMGDAGIGGAVWDCARTACALLHRLPETFSNGGRFAPSTRLLELGTGTAAVGIACWLRGANVTLTDTPVVLDVVARPNAIATVGDGDALPADLHIKPLVWGGATNDQPYDVVIASDCLYNKEALPALLKTLLAVTDAHSVVYLVYKRRLDDRERPFFLELDRHFDSVHVSSSDHDAPLLEDRGIHLCRVARKKHGGDA